MKTPAFLLFCFSAFLLFLSCKKETLFVPSEENHKAQVENGRIKFENLNHLRNIYDWIKTELQELDTASYPTANSFLHHFEEGLGHSSLRNSILNPHQYGRDSSQTTHWLMDEIRMSLLNEHCEIQVGDSVHIYFSENQIYRVHVDDNQAVQDFREIEKGDDSVFAPAAITNDDVTLISRTKKKIIRKLPVDRIGGNYEDCALIISGGWMWDPCNGLHQTLIIELLEEATTDQGITTNLAPVVNSITISWGDGFSDTVSDVSISNHFSHSYQSPGTYAYTIAVDYQSWCSVSGNDLLTVEESMTISSAACYQANFSTSSYVTHGDHLMNCELWVKWDIFGEHQVAKTTSYKWVDPWWGQADWRREKAAISTSLYWSFRDEECNPVATGNIFSGLSTGDWEHANCDNCKTKRADKSHSGDGNLSFLDDEIRSAHTVTKDGVIMENELILSYCD